MEPSMKAAEVALREEEKIPKEVIVAVDRVDLPLVVPMADRDIHNNQVEDTIIQGRDQRVLPMP